MRSDRYLLEISPKNRSFLNDQNNSTPLKRVFGKIKLKQQFDVSWCHTYIDTPRERFGAKGLLISTARAPVQARKEIALLFAILTQCVEWGWIRRNELIGQLRRKRNPPRTRHATLTEIAEFTKPAPTWLRAYLDLKAMLGFARQTCSGCARVMRRRTAYWWRRRRR
jgi:hypothetical protein